MRREGSYFKVGLTVLAALVVVVLLLLMVGKQSFLFSHTNAYFVSYAQVSGLAVGNPVQLNGVAVGRVRKILLPEDPSQQLLQVWIEVESRYENRIRADSVARIKSLGLLGDKYVQITSGSLDSPPIPPGGEIQADQPTDVDALIESGEDVADNIVSTARSLSIILDRMERGEGLLGELLAERKGESVTGKAIDTMDTIKRIGDRIERGEGTLGRLLTDDSLAKNIDQTVTQLDELIVEVRSGDGLMPSLIHDQTTRESFESTLSNLEMTVERLSALAGELEDGNGLLPRLINDGELGDNVTRELEELLERLNQVTGKMAEGDGTVAQLINDPSIYQALNDIVVGINQSKMLRWLIRNRQKAGIKKRYHDARTAAPEESTEPEAPQGSGND